MSFLGLGGNPAAAGGVNQLKIQAAEAELDMVSDMFNRLVDSCHQKCITANYPEGDLNKTESLCLDRCVSKYFEVNGKVGEHMQKLGQSGQSFMGR
ncbi:mitochondrial import inner membrane translocase subunit Tim10p [Trichomonascus vanleenenianus]|uniref:Tim10/DDP family zinc finger protein n=1 Tax=Trichomonascus vanleenenianus TaxID=2268995 RepID=UPI003ECBA1F6